MQLAPLSLNVSHIENIVMRKTRFGYWSSVRVNAAHNKDSPDGLGPRAILTASVYQVIDNGPRRRRMSRTTSALALALALGIGATIIGAHLSYAQQAADPRVRR